MAKMRIVHVLYSFGTGGLEKGIATLANGATPDIEHVVVCLSRSGESARLLPPGTQVLELRKPAGNSLAFIWRLSRVLKQLCPDVVHTRNWSGMDGVVAARLAGIRTVVHGEHGWGVEDPEGLSAKRVRVRRFLSRWVREYTCVSQAMVPWLLNTVGVRRPVTAICNGVDTERYRPVADRAAARREMGLEEGAAVLGVVGRLDPIKDHRTLFRAFEVVRRQYPASRLLVVGDGPERAALEAVAGQGIDFLGDRGDVPEVLRALDVFVLPSLNEGISNTVLEAMASALPVVATRVGGTPELVDDGVTGRLVPVSDGERLATALTEYLSNPDRRQSHGAAGRARAVAEFSVAAMVGAYESVYRRVAGQG